MSSFKCTNCGNTIQTDLPPEVCPACNQKCQFVDNTCYTPDCGGPESDNINLDIGKKEQ